MKIERDDILCLDDIRFFQLEKGGRFANSDIYSTKTEGYLLDIIEEHTAEPLYKVSFAYDIKTEYQKQEPITYKN